MAQARVMPDNFWGGGPPSILPAETAPQDAAQIQRAVDPVQLQQAAQQSSTGYNKPSRTASGDWGKDFLDIAGGYGPSAKNLEQYVFPEFSKLYPGFSMNRNASGYVDALTAPNGQIFDTQRNSGLDRSDAWQWNLANGPGASPMQSSYSAQFSDPLTKQYEQLLQSQTQLYQQQQAQMQAEAQQKQATRAQTDAAVKRLMDFANQRVDQLQKPAYTDSEANILQTRQLDPIERDRTAANKRALDNIGSRGFDPTSGIAQELLRMVNQDYDQQRTSAQSDVAYKQIQEQRSRDQEVQQLLTYLSQAPDAAARGDLSFLNLLNSQINEPGQNALATSALLSDLPVQRTQLANQTLGLGGSPQSSVPNVLALLNNAQNNRMQGQAQSADFWRNLGYSFLS